MPTPPPAGYQAFAANGAQRWFTPVVNPPTDAAPDIGVQAGHLRRHPAAAAPTPWPARSARSSYALDATSGAPLTGWPFFNSDSTHSTAALADLYGTGQNEIIVGGRTRPPEGPRASSTPTADTSAS